MKRYIWLVLMVVGCAALEKIDATWGVQNNLDYPIRLTVDGNVVGPVIQPHNPSQFQAAILVHIPTGQYSTEPTQQTSYPMVGFVNANTGKSGESTQQCAASASAATYVTITNQYGHEYLQCGYNRPGNKVPSKPLGITP